MERIRNKFLEINFERHSGEASTVHLQLLNMHPRVKVKIPDCNRQRIGNPLPPSHEANLVINEENDRVLGRGADLPIAAQLSVKVIFSDSSRPGPG